MIFDTSHAPRALYIKAFNKRAQTKNDVEKAGGISLKKCFPNCVPRHTDGRWKICRCAAFGNHWLGNESLGTTGLKKELEKMLLLGPKWRDAVFMKLRRTRGELTHIR